MKAVSRTNSLFVTVGNRCYNSATPPDVGREHSTAGRNVGPKKRFGVFEFDPQLRELTKHRVPVRLQEQPLQILAVLLEQAGKIVPREDLRRRLWPEGTFVDYEQSLNKAVNKLREALGDSANKPIYIETVSRRGYRFVAPVESDEVTTPASVSPAPGRQMVKWLAAGGFVSALILGIGLWPPDVPQAERVVALTNDTTLKIGIGRLVSDGHRVLYGDGADVWWVPASGGEPKRLSLPFLRGIKILVDYSPIRQQILLGSLDNGNSTGVEVWLAGTDGEAPHKIAEQKPATRTALSPEGERLAFSTPDGIYVQSIGKGQPRKIHPMAGINLTLLPWWHPSGHSVGFLDPPDDLRKARAWQVNDDGTHLRRIVPETEQGQGPGVWSQDGKRFFYLGGEGEVFVRSQRGILGFLRKSVVTRLTSSGQFRTPPAVDPVDPRRLYAVGSVLRGETVRYDRKAQRWVPFMGRFSGERIDRSPDGQWLAYLTFPGSELHRCRIDGSDDVLLAPSVEAVNPHWSPDGKSIAFSGRPAGTAAKFKLWLVTSSGGDAAPYPPGIDSGYDTIWSANGARILLGQGEPFHCCIRILHLKTGALQLVEGTERLFSPRWSADEKQMLAMEADTGRLFILGPGKREWRQFTQYAIGYPNWSRDGKYIYGDAGPIGVVEAVRIEVATGHREKIARTDFKPIGTINSGAWLGWTEDWEPLTVRDLSSTQIYRIDLDR